VLSTNGYQQFTTVTDQDVERSDALALPLVLIALLAIVATVVAACLPLVLGLAAVVVALALIFGIAHLTPTSVFVLSIASIIGLGISLDYSLLLTRRFREELARGAVVRDAVAQTVATAGEAILFSGLSVMIGFLGLVLIGVSVMTSFAIGGSVVVAVAVLAALTLLPALLSLLGHRINALRVPLVGRRRVLVVSPAEPGQGFWNTWALGVMRHPLLISGGVIALIVVLAYPALALKVGVPDTSALPAGADARQGQTILHTQFPDLVLYPISIVAEMRDGASVLTASNLERVERLTEWVRQQPRITSVGGLLSPPTTALGNAPAPSNQPLVLLL
jgi:RND superfamily putative drug exporter